MEWASFAYIILFLRLNFKFSQYHLDIVVVDLDSKIIHRITQTKFRIKTLRIILYWQTWSASYVWHLPLISWLKDFYFSLNWAARSQYHLSLVNRTKTRSHNKKKLLSYTSLLQKFLNSCHCLQLLNFKISQFILGHSVYSSPYTSKILSKLLH